MADKNRIKKAVRVQAASAQVEAELNTLSKMALDLSHQLEQIKRQQADLLNVAVDHGLPKVTRKKKLGKKKTPSSILSVVGISIIALMLIDLTRAATLVDKSAQIKPLCKNYDFERGELAQVLKSGNLQQISIKAAPAYESLSIDEFGPRIDYLQDCIDALSACDGPVERFLSEAYRMHSVATGYLASLESCLREYEYMVTSLQVQNHQISEKELLHKNLGYCTEKLKLIKNIWDKTISLGHSAHHHSFGKQNIETLKTGCVEQASWKEWGYLSNGNNGSCVLGLNSRFDFNVKQCTDKVEINVNAPAYECRIGYRAFGKRSNGNYHLSMLEGNKSCSMGCFSSEELYESFTNQPLCMSCMSPYLDIFWETSCVDDHIKIRNLDITSLIIYSHYTVITTDKNKYTCQNNYNFKECCGGRGPTSESNTVFVDKYCACSMSSVAAVESVYLGLVKTYHVLLGFNFQLILPLLLLVGIVVSPSFSGLMFSCWLIYHLAAAKALCTSDNIVATESVLDTIATNNGFRAEFKVQQDQCVSVGGGLFHITSIQKKHLYRFDKTVPFKTKLTCAKVDWACWGGGQSQLVHRGNECASSCTGGVIKTRQEKVPAFSGSGCAAFWEGVLIRQDLCFSIGEFGSQCRFYRHVSYDPVIVIEGDLIYHGDGKKTHLILTEGETTQGITMEGIMMHHKQVPTSIVKRGALYFCSSVAVEIQPLCGSLTLLKPNDISPDCYETKLEWNHARASYDINYKPKDAEAIMHNSFHLCNQDANVTFYGDEATYIETSSMAVITLISKDIRFTSEHQWCQLDLLKIVSRAGIRGFRQSTHVELHNKMSRICRVSVSLPGCTALQSSLVILPATASLGLEFFCHGNASNNLHLNSNGHVKIEAIKEVNRNWVPLKTTVSNIAIGALLSVDPAKVTSDFMAWISGFRLSSLFSYFLTWLTSNWIKWAMYVVLLLISYNGIVRGNIYNVLISLLLFYLVGFVEFSSAIELNVAVIPSTTIKLIRCNVIWFFQYNLMDNFSLACIADWLLLLIIISIYNVFVNLLASIVFACAIKFYVQYLDEMEHLDELAPVGRELRYPGVISLTDPFQTKMRFRHKYSFDLFSSSENRARFLDWRRVNHNLRRVLLSDGKPVAFEEILPLIRCRKHTMSGIQNVPVNNGYFAYEWIEDKLALYLTAHVVQVNTQYMRRIYGDVYASTYRKPALNPMDGETPKGAISSGYVQGVIDDQMLKGLSGWTLVSGSHFYVVHASQSGKLASYSRAEKPLAPFDVNYTCATCAAEAQSACIAGPSGSQILDNTSFRKEQKRRAPLGNIDVIEHLDAWGIKYDLYREGIRSGLVCRDIQIWAAHVSDRDSSEILPDIMTEGENFRPYAPTEDYKLVYTSFGQDKVYSFIYPRQIFMMFSEDLLLLIEAPVFRSKHKLISGTLVYIWYKGLRPSKHNFKVVSVVTIGRLINGYYYYPIINDTCNICELRSRKNVRHLGYVDRVDYQKMRQLSSTTAIVHNYELAKFPRRNLFRLLSEDNKIVASFEFDNTVDYDPFDWDYHVSCEGSLLLLKHNQVHGVSSTLSDYIDQFDTTSSFCSSIVNADRRVSDPIRIPVISLTLVDDLPDNYHFTIYLRKNSTDNIIYSSGKFVILGHSATLVDLIRSFVRTLWIHGVELIVIRGDLYELVGNSEISPYDFFGGCETRQTPTLIFAADNESLLVDLRQWLQAELETSELETLININDLTIHPDWASGSIALAPTTKHSLTQRSLAEWRSHARYPLEEIDFTSGNWAPMDCESVPELLEISNEDYWVGELQCLTSRGSCVGFENTLLTSRHVTRGASVKIHRRGYSYEWKKPFLDGKQEDLCIYGASLPKVARVSKGEILCVICPFRRIGHFLIVTEEDSQLETRPGAKFNSMRPITVDEHFTKWAPSGWKGQAGMSGCPIFNSSGRLVSIYGLGKIENIDVRFESMDIKLPRVQTALTIMAPDIRPEIVPDAFFRTAATEVVTQKYEFPSTYFLCKAPTGTGKTLYFTKNLMQLISDNQKVVLLQPTVSSVRGAYKRVSDLLDMSNQGHNNYTLRYLIGQRNENISETVGSGNRHLTFMTYGRAIVDLQTIQTSYDYILLDEIHNLNDPTVLACDLALTKPNVAYKCVHLSATLSSDTRATLLASNMVIEGTRFKIDETVHIEPINGSESGDYLLIPKGTMGVNIDGFDKGFKVPMSVIDKGRVIFFLSSRADCEKMVAYCTKNYTSSRQYLAVHAGTTIDLAAIKNNCWMFCTDVVGQSITIPGCHVVVDFLEEIKTTTKLYYNRLGIVYSSLLSRRRIDTFTAQQRRGRTGRTNPGWYITPVGHSPVLDNGVDIRSTAEAILRLRWSGIYSKFNIKDYYCDKILKDIASIEWILPENLVELNVWNVAVNSLSTKYSRSLSRNINDKLKLVIGVNGDLMYLYLTPVISSELIDKSITDQAWSRTGSPSTDREFYKRMEDYCVVVDTEQLRDQLLAEHQLAIYSDKEKVSLSLDLTLELRAMLEVDYESAGGSQMMVEQEDSIICTTMVIAAASCTLLTGIYWWMETTCRRSVTRATSISKDQVVPACKYYTTETRVLEGYSNDSRSALRYIKANIDTAVSWLARIGVDKEKRHSAGLLTMIVEKLEYSFSLIPATWHLGLVPSLAASFGAAMVGSWYVSLEEVLGATLATALMICLNGGLAAIAPLPTVVSCLVIEIVAFIISAVSNRKSNLYDRYGRSMSYPAKAWRLIFGGMSGIALGHMIIAPMIATRPVVTHICSGSSLITPLGPNMGKSGLAINVVKQIYVTLVRIQSNQVGVEVLGPILTSAFSMLALDTTTIVVGVVIVLGLIAVRKAIEHAKYAVGSVAKSTRSGDGRNPYIEDYFGDFDDVALTILSSAAIFSSPTSAISVLISWLNTASRTGRLTGSSFKDSFHVYAGVPIAFTIITEGIKWISTWQNVGEVNHSMLGNLLITIPTALAGIFGSVYYVGKPEVKEILEKTWSFMRDSVMGLVRMVISVIKTVTRASIKWIGRQIGEGMLQNLPSWLRPASEEGGDAIMLSEAFSATCPEPKEIGVWIRDRWEENNGLTLLERLHLSTNISSRMHSGSVPPSSFKAYVKNTGQGVSFMWRGSVNIPFALTKISSIEVNAILGHFTLETNVDAGIISMDRNGYKILTEMAYNPDVSVSWFQVSSAMSTFGFLVVCYPRGEQTEVIVVGYKITSYLMKSILSNLVDVHPVMCQLSELEETSDIKEIGYQLDSKLDFRKHQIVLKWQPFRTTLLLGAVNLYSNLTHTFTKDILSNRFSSSGLPDCWLECPPELTLEYWRVLAYYIFAAYEAGVLAKEFNVPHCGRDLPLQVYSRSSIQWRKIPSGLQHNVEDSSRHIMMKMQPSQCVIVTKKVLANRTSRDSMHEGVHSELTLDKSLTYKNQWVSLAYWQSCTVFALFRMPRVSRGLTRGSGLRGKGLWEKVYK